MSMQVYQMAVEAERGLATKHRWSARDQQTRQERAASSRGRVGMLMVAVIVGALLLGIGAAGVAADESEPLPLTLAERTARSEQTMTDYHDALDQGRSVASFFAPDALLIFAGSEEQIQGRDAIAATFDHLLHGAFAGRLLLANRIVIGESAAEIGDFVGTQIGPFHGTEATGNSVRVPYMVVYELTDGQISTLRFDLPTAEILRQLAVPYAPEDSAPGRPGQYF